MVLAVVTDTWYHRGMTIFHHTIDSGGPGGDPWTLDQNVPVRIIFSHTSTNFQNAFREATHVMNRRGRVEHDPSIGLESALHWLVITTQDIVVSIHEDRPNYFHINCTMSYCTLRV